MFCQQSHEIDRRILRAHPHVQSLVFEGEPDPCISDFLKAVLSNRRPTSIPSRVSQEMLFGLEVIDMGAPPSVFARQQCFEIAGMEIGCQYTSFQSLSEESDHSESPHAHQLLAIKIQTGGPTSS